MNELFIIPNAARWNSMYDALVKTLDFLQHMEQPTANIVP